MKRLALLVTLAAVLAPVGAHAGTATYSTPFQLGPKGGDQYNNFVLDEKTGEMTVIRAQPAGISGGLGCGGSGGFANFAVTHSAAGAIGSVTVAYKDALIDPYTFFNVGVRQGDGYLATTVVRGPILGSGTVTVPLTAEAHGTITVWFGIQVSSACPNVDGGRATFTSVSVVDDGLS